MANGRFTKAVHYLAKRHPLALAVIIDLIMLIPYFSIIITLYLQIVLWTTLKSEYFKWLNIAYDLTGLAHPFINIFPLNTVSVILMMIYKKVPYNI